MGSGMSCLQQNNRKRCAYNIQRSHRQKKTSSGDLQDAMWIGYKHKKERQRAYNGGGMGIIVIVDVSSNRTKKKEKRI